MDWTDLTPSFEEPVSPALTRTVERLNQDCGELPPQNMDELSNLVEDLRSNPPVPADGTSLKEMNAEGPRAVVPPPTPAPTVVTETVAETPRAPLLLAR